MKDYYIISGLIVSITLNIMLLVISIRFGKIIMNFEDRINSSFEKINKSRETIKEILTRPLFYDSPEVKEVLNSIKNVQNTIVQIAGNLDMLDVIGIEDEKEK